MSDRKPKSNNEIFFLIILIINEKVVAQDDTNLLPNKQGIFDHNIVNNKFNRTYHGGGGLQLQHLSCNPLVSPIKTIQIIGRDCANGNFNCGTCQA